jgi:septum formation protein
MSESIRLVLASASPGRLATLRAAGLSPEVVVSGVDEDGVPAGSPAELAQELGALKCRCVQVLGAGLLRAGGAVGSTVVHFADLSHAEIAAYVATGEPLQVAGAFTIDGRGGPFVRAIEGDPSNVVGISLPLLRMLLEQLGIPWTSLW